MEKRVYRSDEEKMICGVCGGIAEYFDLDPSWVRIAVAIFCMMAGVGVFGYFVAALIIPKRPEIDVIEEYKDI
ncbi:MAG: PspC domain-containing protein [Eubacteriales bacterium]|nr:PspC domain-containing protein [Eubacteriales bacterium]